MMPETGPAATPRADAVRVRLDFNEWWVETMAGRRITSREKQPCEADARRVAARYSAEQGLDYLPIMLPPPCRYGGADE